MFRAFIHPMKAQRIKGLKRAPEHKIFDPNENMEALRNDLLLHATTRGTNHPFNRHKIKLRAKHDENGTEKIIEAIDKLHQAKKKSPRRNQ